MQPLFSWSIIRLVFLFFICLVTLILSIYLPAIDKYWFIPVTLLLSIITSGENFITRLKMILSAGVFILIGVFYFSLISSYFLLVIVSLILCSFVCTYIGLKYPNYTYGCLLFMIFSINAFASPIATNMIMNRCYSVAVAILMSLIFQLPYAYKYTVHNVEIYISQLVKHLSSLSQVIFSCFLNYEYQDNLYLFERRVHIQKLNCLEDMLKLRKHNTSVATKLSNIFSIILAYGELRYRVTDIGEFDICKTELKGLDKAISKVFLDVIAKREINLDEFNNNLDNLEDIYENVLQVTAKEPLVFLLFINNLKSLRSELMGLYAS